MKADLTRDTFDASHHFRRVLHQQGRVTLDADPNEQAAILLHYLQALARDLIGPYGAPAIGGGFQLTVAEKELMIGAGNFYVDGILVENDAPCSYNTQPDYRAADDDALVKELRQSSGTTFWAYLDVWERHVSWVEQPHLLEPALNGVDTCTRSKVVWQVKAVALDRVATDNGTRDKRAALEKQLQSLKQEREKTTAPAKIATLDTKIAAISAQLDELAAADGGAAPAMGCAAPLVQLVGLCDARLAARVDPGQVIEDACTIAPDALYRGAENQLYRVEIHRGGQAGTATFKWSRDNGSVAAAWLGTEGNDLLVSHTHGFEAGNWVELAHDALALNGLPGALVKLAKVDHGVLTIDPDSVPTTSVQAWTSAMHNPSVRRWDQVQIGDTTLDQGAVPIVESTATAPYWLDLEDGVQVSFAAGGTYRAGDYWLIPARVATGQVEWPLDDLGVPAMRAPAGVQHHYAPLGFIAWNDGQVMVNPCRCEFARLAICP
jgi:hypothetical protein